MIKEPTHEDDQRFYMKSIQKRLQLAQTHTSDNKTLEKERADIMDALEESYKLIQRDSASDELSNLFIDAVIKFSRYLGFSGGLKSRVEWGKKALEVAERLGDELTIAELCASIIAWPLLQLGDYEQTKVYCERGLQASLQSNAPRWAGEASRSLSGIARDQLRAEEAQYWAERAMEYAQQINHRGLQLGATLDLAYAAIISHDYHKAENLFRGLVQIYEEDNDDERIANRTGDLAMTLLNLGRNDEAQTLYERGYAIAQDLKNEVMMGETEFGLAKLAEIRGDYKLAESLKLKAKHRFEMSGITRPGRVEQFVFVTTKPPDERT